jgi:hypothetical protein
MVMGGVWECKITYQLLFSIVPGFESTVQDNVRLGKNLKVFAA